MGGGATGRFFPGSARRFGHKMLKQETTESGDQRKNDQGRLDRFWPAVVDAIRSYAANQRTQAKESEGPQTSTIARWTKVTGLATIAAAVFAAIAAVAFWCANYDARQIFQQSHRAFVFASAVKFSVGNQGGRTVDVDFTNSGETPTRGLQWFAYWGCEHDLFPLTRFDQAVGAPKASDCKLRKPRTGLIGPHATITDFESGFYPRDLSYIPGDGSPPEMKRPKIDGWIAYQDVFGTPRRTYFCYEVYRDGDNIKAMSCSDTPPCADEECARYHPDYDKRMEKWFWVARQSVPKDFRATN